MTIGEFCKLKGKTAKDLAKAMNISREGLYNLRGTQKSIEKIVKCFNRLGVQVTQTDLFSNVYATDNSEDRDLPITTAKSLEVIADNLVKLSNMIKELL